MADKPIPTPEELRQLLRYEAGDWRSYMASSPVCPSAMEYSECRETRPFLHISRIPERQHQWRSSASASRHMGYDDRGVAIAPDRSC